MASTDLSPALLARTSRHSIVKPNPHVRLLRIWNQRIRFAPPRFVYCFGRFVAEFGGGCLPSNGSRRELAPAAHRVYGFHLDPNFFTVDFMIQRVRADSY